MMAHQSPILHELVDSGKLTPEQADAIHEEHLEQGQTVHDIAVEQGFVDDSDYLASVAHLLNTEVVDLAAMPVLPILGKTVPASIARMYRAAPMRIDGEAVVLAISDFPSHAVTDDIAFVLSKRIDYVVASAEEVDGAILKLYGEENDSINELLSELESDLEDASDLIELGDAADLADLEHAASATPVIRFVNLVLY